MILAGLYVAMRFLLPALLGGNPPLAHISITFAPLLTFVAALFALRTAWDKHQRRGLLARQSSLDTLREMSWQDFERLVGEAYQHQGYRVAETGGSEPDGGVDLVLRRNGETVLVQCKRWKQVKVGAPTVRELRGAVARDGAALLELVRQAQGRTAPAQETLPPVQDASVALPTCSKCGELLLKRTARSGVNAGSEFWGCPAFPRCRGTRQI